MWVLALSVVGALAWLVHWRRSGQTLPLYIGRKISYLYGRIWHGCTHRTLQRLPDQGAFIVAANHTSSPDAVFLVCGCRRTLSFLVAREYYKIGILRYLFNYTECVPVSRNGQDVAGVRLALRLLEGGRAVCIFPEGGLSAAGRDRPRPGKQGVALLALRSRAPVFPALILNGPQTSIASQAWMRPSRVRVIYGRAMDLSEYYGRPLTRKLLADVTQLVMDAIDGLRGDPRTA